MKQKKCMSAAALVLAGLILLGISAPAAGAPWVPVDCTDRDAEVAELRAVSKRPAREKAWHSYVQRVRRAEPGESLYVPHPFPKSREEIFEDFEHTVLHRLFSSSRDLSDREASFRSSLMAGEISYELHRVENWSPGRCTDNRPILAYHLLRLRDRQGSEIARAALHLSGVFSQFAFVEPRVHAVPELSGIGETIEEHHGLDLRIDRPQYVKISGLPQECSPVMPCVAFRSGGDVYLLDHGMRLFRVPRGAAVLSVMELKERDRGILRPVNLERENRPWVTVGFEWREAQLVAGELP